MMVDSCCINYIGKYNLIHNKHVNKYHSVNTKKSIEKIEKSIHLHLSPCLNFEELTTHHKVEGSSNIKCNPYSQQSNLHNLKIKDGFDEGYNSYG